MIEGSSVRINLRAMEGSAIPGPRPTPIELTPRQQAIIEPLARSQTKAHRLVQRASMILKMAAGANNEEAARLTNTTRITVRLWRQRWLDQAARLQQVEAEGGEQQRVLAEMIEEVLMDEERSGAPPTFTPEQIVQIVAVACENPEESNRPISHWTPRELAEEAIARKIVESISSRSVERFLKSSGFTTTSGRVLAER
jgi:putative transposase